MARLVLCCLVAGLLSGCLGGPPRQPDDLCAIFREKRDWRRAAERSFERWGIAPSVQVAFVHQESRFRAKARPPRRRILWVIPGPRLSSAYGYGQVKEGTWEDYRRLARRGGADRDDFGDVADFIGWYGDLIHRQTAIPKTDAHRLYLAYHEGPTGFRRGSHERRPWLEGVARKVARRAGRYALQYASCREELEGHRRFWIF